MRIRYLSPMGSYRLNIHMHLRSGVTDQNDRLSIYLCPYFVGEIARRDCAFVFDKYQSHDLA